MPNREIKKGSLRAPGGKVYGPNSSEKDLDELNGLLEPDRASALTESGMLVGFKGSSKAAKAEAPNPSGEGEGDDARPQGTEKDKKGEPKNREPEKVTPWTKPEEGKK
jgi:hypothetical protein